MAHPAVQILALTAEHFGVTVAMVVAKDRHKSATCVRHIAMYLCRTVTGASYPELGQLFRRDHSTVISGVRRIERMRVADGPDWAKTRRHIDAIIRAAAGAVDYTAEQTVEQLDLSA